MKRTYSEYAAAPLLAPPPLQPLAPVLAPIMAPSHAVAAAASAASATYAQTAARQPYASASQEGKVVRCFYFFHKGGCRNGEACKFSHVGGAAEEAPRAAPRPMAARGGGGAASSFRGPRSTAEGDARDDTVYLMNVNYRVSGGQLAECLERRFGGRVLEVRLGASKVDGKDHGGSAWVKFESAATARHAATFGEIDLRGRAARIVLSRRFGDGVTCAAERPAGRGALFLQLRACRDGEQAMRLLRDLGPLSDSREYTLALGAMGKCKMAAKIPRLLAEMRASGLEPDLIVYNAAISAAGNGGDWALALAVLGQLRASRTARPDVISFNAAMTACDKAGKADEALDLFGEMRRSGLKATTISYNALIGACGKRDDGWRTALELLDAMRRDRCRPDPITYNATITCCERCGRGDDASRVYARALAAGETLGNGDGLWDARGRYCLHRLAGPHVARAAARLAIFDVRDRPRDRAFHALDATVEALDADSGEAYDADGDDLVFRTALEEGGDVEDGVSHAVRDLVEHQFPALDVAVAAGALAISWASLRDWCAASCPGPPGRGYGWLAPEY